MANILPTICLGLFLIITLPAQGFASEHFPFLAEVTKDSINVRAGSNTNFEKIDKLSKGTVVVVLGRSYEWYKIQPMPTTKAYIRSDYLKTKEGSIVASVSGNKVNVRASPNSDSASLGRVEKGTLVKILEQAHGWCRITPVAGLAAWVYKDFLKETSADVPDSMLIAAVQWPTAGGSVDVSLRATVEPLSEAPAAGVHYELTLEGKPVYYLQDMPQMSFFSNKVVDVKGSVILNPQKKFTYPLLHVNKISLVL